MTKPSKKRFRQTNDAGGFLKVIWVGTHVPDVTVQTGKDGFRNDGTYFYNQCENTNSQKQCISGCAAAVPHRSDTINSFVCMQ